MSTQWEVATVSFFSFSRKRQDSLRTPASILLAPLKVSLLLCLDGQPNSGGTALRSFGGGEIISQK